MAAACLRAQMLTCVDLSEMKTTECWNILPQKKERKQVTELLLHMMML